MSDYYNIKLRWRCSLSILTSVSLRWRVTTCTRSSAPTSVSTPRWTSASRSTTPIFASSASTGTDSSRPASTPTATSTCSKTSDVLRPLSTSSNACSSTHSSPTTRSTILMNTTTASTGESHPTTTTSSSRPSEQLQQKSTWQSILSIHGPPFQSKDDAAKWSSRTNCTQKNLQRCYLTPKHSKRKHLFKIKQVKQLHSFRSSISQF